METNPFLYKGGHILEYAWNHIAPVLVVLYYTFW